MRETMTLLSPSCRAREDYNNYYSQACVLEKGLPRTGFGFWAQDPLSLSLGARSYVAAANEKIFS